MDSIFTYRDEKEGKVGIGKLPNDLQYILSDISKEFYRTIPDKNASTYHTWYDDMSPKIKSKVEIIQKNIFWNKLCDASEKCIIMNANEMDELYYSNPKNNLNKINLYGAYSNYDIHRDCMYNFDGIRFYRIIIGLTDGNDNVKTHFTNLNIGHKLNSGDYIAFDFDKTTHQVIKEKNKPTQRIILKLHYIVCEDCKYSKSYVETIKNFYLWYEYITRYIMNTGTDPETFYQFWLGLGCQYSYIPYIQYIVLFIILLIIIFIRFVLKIKLIYKNLFKYSKYILITIVSICAFIVFCYWSRYKLFGIK